MRAKTLFIVVLSTGLLPIASADPASVQITNAWIREVAPAATDTAAYMKIRNLSQTPLQLVGGSSTIARKVEPMVTTKQTRSGHEVLGMETVTGLTIPGHGTLELKPGGDHLMIMGLLSRPKEGDQVKLTLKFSPGDQQTDLQIPVSKQPPK
jgi:periplasmic copper chaperone A